MKKSILAMSLALVLIGHDESTVYADPVENPKAIDLDDKKTWEKIIAEAIDADKLQKRGKKGEELTYAPNEETLYTGWGKGIYGNGQIKGLAQLKDGKLDGLVTEWRENGRKLGYDTYKDGKKDGPSIGWFGNGKKRVEVNYKDGQQQGIRRNWYENGTKKSEYTYKQGKLITAAAWKINGERCIETDVVDGDGVGVFYGNDGVVKGQSTYTAGSEVSGTFYSYHPNGLKRSEMIKTYSKDMIEGPSTFITWDENGCKTSETNWLGKRRHGLHTYWNTNGEKSAVHNYKNDKLDGPMIQWNKNGQKRFCCNYQEGKPDGLSNSWYINGKKRKTQTWDNGKLISTVVWKPNGEKCPVSKIDRVGNGVVVWYNLTGREKSRRTYKEGKVAEDDEYLNRRATTRPGLPAVPPPTAPPQ